VKGTLVMHGGFDSWIEEFYPMMRVFADHGYEVLAFEGPGQGGTRKDFDLVWNQEWEKPTAAVLDYFSREAVTLYGISMGGYLCLRAAAFEPRIARVVSSGGAVDYWQIPPVVAQWLMRVFLHFDTFTNKQIEKKMQKDLYHRWFAENSMYITGLARPVDAMKKMMEMTQDNLHPENITQDVLVLSSRNDHFIPIKMHKKTMRALSNAHSVSGRIFFKDEQAHNHCQIGNIGLACRVVLDWLEEFA
jgi:pimeloyl-ACP methyl ester carboxylesterase